MPHPVQRSIAFGRSVSAGDRAGFVTLLEWGMISQMGAFAGGGDKICTENPDSYIELGMLDPNADYEPDPVDDDEPDPDAIDALELFFLDPIWQAICTKQCVEFISEVWYLVGVLMGGNWSREDDPEDCDDDFRAAWTNTDEFIAYFSGDGGSYIIL